MPDLRLTDSDFEDMGMSKADILSIDAKLLKNDKSKRIELYTEMVQLDNDYKLWGDGTYRKVDKSGVTHIIDLETGEHKTLSKEATELRQVPEKHFYKCPGLVGDMVREICEYSPQPYPSFAFAAAVSTVGAIKGSFSRLANVPLALSSNLFFFCFADTGKGKNEPRRAMMEVLKRARQTEILTGRIRSDVGFLADLAHSEGVKTVMYDEAHHLFEAMKGKQAASYLTNVKEVMLRLFTEWSSPHVDPGLVLSQQSRIKPLCYPSVSFCGFGVSRGFEDAFDAVDFADGLISRFIFFFDDRPAVSLRNAKETSSYEFERDPRWLDLIDMGIQYRVARRNFQDATPSEKIKDFKFREVPMTAAARECYLSFSDEVTEGINERANTGEVEIETRIVEQAGRISLALSDDVVTVDTVEWAVNFCRMYIATIRSLVYDTHSSQDSKNCAKILKVMHNAKQPLTLTQIGTKSRTLKFREIKEILGYLMSAGKVVSTKTRSGKRGPLSEQFFAVDNTI